MGSNVEIKARVRDWQTQRATAEALGGSTAVLIEQTDTFFRVPHGRLKLRRLSAVSGELIFYHRPDVAGPKLSEYSITPVADPDGLRATLAHALGVAGEVVKRRWLSLSSRFGCETRIHLDEVRGLGQFLELEVVLQPGVSHAEGEGIAASFRAALDIRDDDLIDCAYVDLLAAASAGP